MRIHRLLLAAFLFLAPSIAAAQIVVPVGGGGSGVPSIAGTANQINESGSPGATTLSLSSTIVAPGSITIPSGDLILNGSGSGSSTLNAPATGGGTVTLPAGSVGLVGGPASATSGHIATFNGTTGTLIQDGGAVPAGTLTSLTCGTGIACSPSTITSTGSVTPTVVQNAQSGTTYATLSTDANKIASMNNASAVAVSLTAATGAGFTAGFGLDYYDIGAGITTVTAATSNFDNALHTLALAQGQDSYVWSDGTNYHATVSLPVMAADSVLGNFSAVSNYPIASVLTSCSAATSAVTYNTSTHAFGCNTISGSGTVNTGTAGHGAYYASSTTAVSDAGSAQVTFGGINLTSATAVANGFVLGTANTIYFNTASNTHIAMTTSSLSGNGTHGWNLNFNSSSSTVPTVNPDISSSTSGLGGATNVPAMIVSGATIESWASTGPNIAVIPSDTGLADATLCRVTATGAVDIGTGTAGICLGTSSARFKHGIGELDRGLSDIMALKPKTYFLNADHGDPTKMYYGFLAEDVVKVLPKLVVLDAQKRPNSVDYLGMVPVLVKAVQQQQEQIEHTSGAGQQAQINSLQRQIYFLWAVLAAFAVGFGYLYRRTT